MFKHARSDMLALRGKSTCVCASITWVHGVVGMDYIRNIRLPVIFSGWHKTSHIPSLLICMLAGMLPFRLCAEDSADRAVEFVRSHPAPDFREGNVLPPLSISHHAFPLDLMRELAANWGYALTLPVGLRTHAEINDPTSRAGSIVALVRENPEAYKLSLRLLIARGFRGGRPIDFDERYPDLINYPEAFYRDAGGALIDGEHHISVLAPDAAISLVAEHWADKVKAVAEAVPVEIMVNWSEYGFEKPQRLPLAVALRDPTVLQSWSDDGRPWLEFASDHKARQEKIIRDALVAAAPGSYYVKYSEIGSGHYMLGARPDWMAYDFYFRPGIVDFACGRYYYRHSNSGFTHIDRDRDLLAHLLVSRAQEIDAGMPYGYFWVSGGWESPTGVEHKRVVARRHRERPEWLLTAWAADAEPAELSVNVPELGEIKIKATAEGNPVLIRRHNYGIEYINPRDPEYRASLPEVRPLREQLQWREPSLRPAAVQRLAAQMLPEDIVPKLEAWLDDSFPGTRSEALRQLVSRVDPLCFRRHGAFALGGTKQSHRSRCQYHRQRRYLAPGYT